MILMLIGGLIAFAIVFYLFLISNYNYWNKFGVRVAKPKPFVGNYPSAFTQKRHMTYDLQDIYEEFKHTENFVGIFNCRNPQLLITDGELVRRIFTTDFKHFHDNEVSAMVNDKSDFIFANNPFALAGETWKERRSEVTPGFTVSRIKTVFPITNNVCSRLIEFIDKQTKMGPKDGIEAKDITLRFTTEVVTDCVLGLKAESFTEKPTPIMGKISKIFETNFNLIVYSLVVGLLPSVQKFWKMRFIPKPIEKFLVDLMQDALQLRKTQQKQGLNSDRIDYLNYMLQLQQKKNLSTMQVTAHTMTFLFDGFETTAGVLAHTLLFLSRDLERQQKLRDEILEKLGKTNDFETVMELPYLDACIHESLRIFPPGSFSNKICTQSIELTNKNGQRLELPEGTVVVLPLHAIMADAEYYSNPDCFEPERFLEENGGLKKYRDMGAYYGFGEGPRMCLGMRFALCQLKGALVDIVRNYEVHANPKTRKDNLFDAKYFLPRLDGGIWLDFKKIE